MDIINIIKSALIYVQTHDDPSFYDILSINAECYVSYTDEQIFKEIVYTLREGLYKEPPISTEGLTEHWTPEVLKKLKKDDLIHLLEVGESSLSTFKKTRAWQKSEEAKRVRQRREGIRTSGCITVCHHCDTIAEKLGL